MSPKKDQDKLLAELRRQGWRVDHGRKSIKVHHPDGGFVTLPFSPSSQGSIHASRRHVEILEQENAEKKRKKLLSLNSSAAAAPQFPARKFAASDLSPTPKQRSHQPMSKHFPANSEPPASASPGGESEAFLELLAEFATQLKAIQETVNATKRAVDQLNATLQDEKERKADEAAYQKRLAIVEAELKDLQLKATKVLTFENEPEQVAMTKAIHSWARTKDRDFRVTKEGLMSSIWRVK